MQGHCLLKSVVDQRVVVAVTDHICDDPSVIQIQDRAKIEFLFLCSHVIFEFRDIRQPFLVWCICMEIPVKDVFCNMLRILVADRAAFSLVLDRRLNVQVSADTEHTVVADLESIDPEQVIIDPTVSLVRILFVDLKDSFCDGLIDRFVLRRYTAQPFVIRGPWYSRYVTKPTDAGDTFFIQFFDRLVSVFLSYSP